MSNLFSEFVCFNVLAVLRIIDMDIVLRRIAYKWKIVSSICVTIVDGHKTKIIIIRRCRRYGKQRPTERIL